MTLDLAGAARLVGEARNVGVLTGAGISAESGIPTFRDAMTGLWATFDPEELATMKAFRRQPRLVWDWYAERRARVGQSKPNAGHLALVELEKRVESFTLVTQNIDGLHQAAGSRNVVELHGNIRRVKCAGEDRVVEQWDETGDLPPRCSACGDYLRPDVVWFGEILPEEGLRQAWQVAEQCDLFLSIGTSNLVEPAASLPWIAHQHGATVLVINPTADGQRHGARIHHLQGRSGDLLPVLVGIS